MTIWILILGTMALSLFAAARVKSVYRRYNRGAVLSGVTGGEAAALFNLVTLPVEFDASRRAKLVLRNLNLIAPGSEAVGVSKVLNAAAWTYVAAFITSLAYFLWHLLPLLNGRNRD